MPGPTFDDAVRAELKRAFTELRPHMLDNARLDADLDPDSRIDDFDPADLEQFLNAYQALFFEAVDGKSRETRDLVLDTALPPVLELTGTPLTLVRSNVISAVMLTHRLVPLIREDLRDEAARWLAWFYSDYTEETARRALDLEAERP
jgi:hypothetical protein